ncbi:MAG: hypothetical protein ACOYMN_21185, partial [Roseimicrobium sp.]
RKRNRRLLVLTADICCIIIALVLAFLLRSDFVLAHSIWKDFGAVLVVVLAVLMVRRAREQRAFKV